jgi:hypothetical protein
MRVSEYLRRLEKGDWDSLLHHRSKTTQSEIKSGVVAQLQKHLRWLLVGLDKVPEKEISQVLSARQTHKLFSSILKDTPFVLRWQQLEEEIKEAQLQIDKLSMSKDKQDRNRVKALRRKVTVRQKEMEGLAAISDERRLETARLMVQYGIEHITGYYQDAAAAGRDDASREKIDTLKQSIDLSAKMVQEIPKLRVIQEALTKYERKRREREIINNKKSA